MFGPIKTVALYVEDQQKSLDFYTFKLGFELRRSMALSPDAAWLEIAPPGAESSLVLYPKSMMQQWDTMRPSIVFHCPNIDSTIDGLRSKGVKVAMEPTDMPWGKFAAIEDIDGNQIGLTEQSIATVPESVG